MRVLVAVVAAIAAAVAGVAIAHSRDGSTNPEGRPHHSSAVSHRGSARDAACPPVTTPKLRTTTAPAPAALVDAVPLLARPRRAGDAPPAAGRTALALLRVRGANLRAARRIAGRDAWVVPVRDVGGDGCRRHRARSGAVVVGASALYPLVVANTRQIALGGAALVQPCAGDGELIHVGALFAGHVSEASLLAPDGSSVQATVSDGYAEFLLPLRDAPVHRTRVLQWTDDGGATRRQQVLLPGVAVHCAPAPMSVARAVGGSPSALRLVPLLGDGPRLPVRLTARDQQTCVRVGSTPGQPCADRGALSNQDGLAGWGARLQGGTLVLAGLADPSTISAIRVRRVGWPSGMRVTLPVSNSGAFALAERGTFVHGAAWQLRTILHSGRPGVLRSVGLGPSLGGAKASRIAEQLVAHYAVLRRPRTPADVLPAGNRAIRLGATTQFDANPAYARRVGRGGHPRFWLVPGQRSVCVVEVGDGNRGGGVGCGSTDWPGLYDGHKPMGSTTYAAVGPRGHARRRSLVFVLLPDGSSDARFVHGRSVRRLGIHANGVVLLTRHGGRISWGAPDGSRHSLRVP